MGDSLLLLRSINIIEFKLTLRSLMRNGASCSRTAKVRRGKELSLKHLMHDAWSRNDINWSNNSYVQESNGGLNAAADVETGSSGYNPYLHGPSKGEYLKQQNIETIPTALVAQPDLIKVETVPQKVVFDFTKRSNNARLLEEGVLDRFESEQRCDSKIKPEDLKRLEIELKKKQKRRVKR
jgi:hypothetical protein